MDVHKCYSPVMVLRVYSFNLHIAEKVLSHSQDVTGSVPRILNATLIFSKPGKEIALRVDEILSGNDPE